MTTTCIQPNCNGVIDDGYCDCCGMAQKSAASQTVTSHPLNSGLLSNKPRTSPTSPTGSRTRGSSSTRSSRSQTGTIAQRSRRQLGLGLVSIPELPSTQPEQSLLLDTKVPDSKRICARCDNALRRDKGFCPQCGQKYCFIPSLQAGDLVAGQYEVKGAMAYGGLGWIYLGYDRTLNRYVVLKGLLNTEDAASAAVAVAERQFLASVKHANIVGIYNFVNHNGEGFIVMEYVGGKTLKELRKERGPLPVAEAIAYIHRILIAFSYLHQQGLVYCDFKPDNIMLEGDDVKLIDLGGVRRLDDPDGDIYGTVGYNAPEAGDGPTIVSDLFTIGRSLAVLLINIPSFGSTNQYTLPSDDPLLIQEESLYRFLLKSTAQNPDDRFQTADEMADQLLGVLREVVARQTGNPQPSQSNLFSGDALSLQTLGNFEPIAITVAQLPMPAIPAHDVAFSELLKYIGIADLTQRMNALERVEQIYPDSRATQFKLLETLQNMYVSITTKMFLDQADDILKQLHQADPWDWRGPWYQGRAAMLRGKFSEAQTHFEQVYADLPGELAPKLALALAAEAHKNIDRAEKLYSIVAQTDLSYTSTLFGLARCALRQGDRTRAVQSLRRVPVTAKLHNRAQVEIARTLINCDHQLPAAQDLKAASGVIAALKLEAIDRHKLAQQVLVTSLNLIVEKKIQPDQSVDILGQPLQEVQIRLGLEKALRELARLATGNEKIRLVDEANQVRPKTLF
jgi:serine/threonine-protein kinase PknG